MSNVIRQTRDQVETLTWLRAILLICAEGRKALADVSEALRDGESIRTSCATYVAESFQESVTMIDIVDRSVRAGHFERVWTAGVYATFRAVAAVHRVRGVAYTPTGHETDELFLAIEHSTDPVELEEIAAYIKAELDDDDDYDYDDDDEFDNSALAENDDWDAFDKLNEDDLNAIEAA